MKKEKTQQRSEILDHAIELANEIGWNSISMRKLAHKMGTSTIVIYGCFANKDEIFTALKMRGFSLLQAGYQPSGAAAEDLMLLAKHIWKFSRQYQSYYQIMFALNVVNVQQAEQPKIDLMTDKIKEMLSQVKQGEVRSLFFNWISLIHGFIAYRYSFPEFDTEDYYRFYLEAIQRFLQEPHSNQELI